MTIEIVFVEGTARVQRNYHVLCVHIHNVYRLPLCCPVYLYRILFTFIVYWVPVFNIFAISP